MLGVPVGCIGRGLTDMHVKVPLVKVDCDEGRTNRKRMT